MCLIPLLRCVTTNYLFQFRVLKSYSRDSQTCILNIVGIYQYSMFQNCISSSDLTMYVISNKAVVFINIKIAFEIDVVSAVTL